MIDDPGVAEQPPPGVPASGGRPQRRRLRLDELPRAAATDSADASDADSMRAAAAGQRWRVPVAVVTCAVLAAVAAVVGKDALLESTDGRITPAVADPSAPGFEAIAEPTPLLSVAIVDAEGNLSSVTLLALSGEDRGAVLVLPADTLVDDGLEAPVVLRGAYRGTGAEGLDHALDRLLGFDAGEVLVLDPRGLEQLLVPAAPLQVQLVDDIVADQNGASVVRFEAGPTALSASEVVEVLLTSSPSVTELARMARVESVWSAWIEAVAGGGAAAIAGETATGLGQFLLGLAERDVGVATPPMVVATLPGADEDAQLYSLDPDGTAELLLVTAPFPVSGFDGQRLRARVLDGTGRQGAAVLAAEQMVRAGAEITIIGNAPTFDATDTRLLFHREEDRQRVEALRDALGAGQLVLVDEPDVAENVTVILGSDTVVSGG